MNIDELPLGLPPTGLSFNLGVLMGIVSGGMVGGAVGTAISGCMLAAAYAELGDFDRAIENADAALKLLPPTQAGTSLVSRRPPSCAVGERTTAASAIGSNARAKARLIRWLCPAHETKAGAPARLS